jgi:hypothetical protein
LVNSRNVIGVACRDGEEALVREFFELFKTPWEFYQSGSAYSAVVSTDPGLRDVHSKLLVLYSSAGRGHPIENASIDYGDLRVPIYGALRILDRDRSPLATLHGSSAPVVVELQRSPVKVLRVGYDLFQEINFLLTAGQPVCNAATPTLELHIAMLRNWILSAGASLTEIPPAPLGYDSMACLTHDVDFVRLRDYRFDHTMLGFVRRASVGSVMRVAKGQMSWSELRESWKALLSLPAIHAGLCEDPWFRDFDRFVDLETKTKSTYFFVPFKNRSGENVDRPHSQRRAVAYDVANEQPLLRRLADAGNEIGVHGIDAWRSVEQGREEHRKLADLTGNPKLGVRMHWLCFNQASPRVLEQAGFLYDSTFGYNDTVGLRAGTLQVFRPPAASSLLELPLNIQDTALFYPGRAAAAGNQAWVLCDALLKKAAAYGGVLTVLWHTRSLAPERLWGNFYLQLLGALQTRRVWFGTASRIVEWFRKRRAVSFQGAHSPEVGDGLPDLALRVYRPAANSGVGQDPKQFVDVRWTGQPVLNSAATLGGGSFGSSMHDRI